MKVDIELCGRLIAGALRTIPTHLREQVLEHAREVAGLDPAPRGAVPIASQPEVSATCDDLPIASDRDIDSQRGDPEVKISPRNWRGADQRGKRMSECPAEFLAQLAHLLEWKAGKNAEEGKALFAEYDRLDAARARGWAKRLASKSSPVPSAPSKPREPDDGVPF